MNLFTRDTDRPIRPVPTGCGQARWPERRCGNAWPDTVPVEPAEACTDLGADDDDLCRPPFNRATLAVLAVSGIGMASVIGWAVVARWPLI